MARRIEEVIAERGVYYICGRIDEDRFEIRHKCHRGRWGSFLLDSCRVILNYATPLSDLMDIQIICGQALEKIHAKREKEGCTHSQST